MVLTPEDHGEAEPERVDKSRLSPWRSPAESLCTGRYLRRHFRSLRSHTPSPPPGRLRWHARRRVCCSSTESAASSLLTPVGCALPGTQGVHRSSKRCVLAARAGCGAATNSRHAFFGHFRRFFLSLAFDVINQSMKQRKADMAYRSRAHRHPSHPRTPAAPARAPHPGREKGE